MRILHINPTALFKIPCISAAPGGRRVEHRTLPIFTGQVDQLPGRIDALIATSDLQGYTAASLDLPLQHRVLMGHALAAQLDAMCEDGTLPHNPLNIGIVLAGDLYAIPTLLERGGLGDVNHVWLDFLHRFRWVAGVGGNHDTFKGHCDVSKAFLTQNNAHLLDHGDVVDIEGLKVAGVSGVIGKRSKPWRYGSHEFSHMMHRTLPKRPDVLVLHQGPDHPEERLKGSHEIREALTGRKNLPLVICGHSHWPTPLTQIPDGPQVLNVDYRAVILTPCTAS